MDPTVPGSVYLVVGFSLVVAFFLGCGYVLNIFKLIFGSRSSSMIWPFRVIGVFVPILGAILGYM